MPPPPPRPRAVFGTYDVNLIEMKSGHVLLTEASRVKYGSAAPPGGQQAQLDNKQNKRCINNPLKDFNTAQGLL